jgi:hypothetical protein
MQPINLLFSLVPLLISFSQISNMSVLSRSRREYTAITTSPRPTPLELTPTQATSAQTNFQRNVRTHLGKPVRKATFDRIDLCVVLGSFGCLAATICAVTPHLQLSWQLGFEGQIVAIGFLLSIMNLLLKKLTPTLLLTIESRWGGFTLQTYDAILRNAAFSPHTAIFWRLTILVFLFLHLGLSIGYKRFTGGTSGAVITNTFSGRYGLAAPPLGDYNAMNNSIYFSISANVDFLTASSNDSMPPPSIPTAYGYNTLLLDNTSAAFLDIPLPDYTSSIQQSLAGSDIRCNQCYCCSVQSLNCRL